jgi:hypothetical protein
MWADAGCTTKHANSAKHSVASTVMPLLNECPDARELRSSNANEDHLAALDDRCIRRGSLPSAIWMLVLLLLLLAALKLSDSCMVSIIKSEFDLPLRLGWPCPMKGRLFVVLS